MVIPPPVGSIPCSHSEAGAHERIAWTKASFNFHVIWTRRSGSLETALTGDVGATIIITTVVTVGHHHQIIDHLSAQFQHTRHTAK